jgi:hypothetical protein
MKTQDERFRWLLPAILIAAVAAIVGGLLAFSSHKGEAQAAAAGQRQIPAQSDRDRIAFTDLDSQMHEYIGYNRSIRLTAEQEKIKRAALESRPAACCDDYTAYTCCCECNLSKSVWGLSNYLIATKGYSADDVSRTVAEWLTFANPGGFSGDACYEGGCPRSPSANGCGGMDESHVVS